MDLHLDAGTLRARGEHECSGVLPHVDDDCPTRYGWRCGLDVRVAIMSVNVVNVVIVVVVWTVRVRVLKRMVLVDVDVLAVMRGSAPEDVRHESDVLGGAAR
jgi:hypothetical protein